MKSFLQLIAGLPFRVPLAMLIGLLDLIPWVGATVAAVVVGVGVGVVFSDFPTATIIWALCAIIYQQVENNVIQPRIQSRGERPAIRGPRGSPLR